MAIRAPNNLYRGINAHLHSILQNEPGEWESFHAAHIERLRSAIEQLLPSNYYALGKRGLQIREHNDYEEEDFLTAVVIYAFEKDWRDAAPVTHLELLSPISKPPERGHEQYLWKREALLRGDLCLVELDYLHQTHAMIRGIPDYPAREHNATPYTISVSDPRPTVQEGVVRVHCFRVDEPIPTITIPLSGSDQIKFDFGTIYNQSYVEQRYHSIIVDYAELPEKFDTYSPFDQERIRQVMARVAANPPE